MDCGGYQRERACPESEASLSTGRGSSRDVDETACHAILPPHVLLIHSFTQQPGIMQVQGDCWTSLARPSLSGAYSLVAV